MTKPFRRSDMTETQRQAIEQARRLLQPFFAGETVRVDIPKILSEDRQARQARIYEALRRGEQTMAIASREDVTVRLVQLVRRRCAGHIGRKSPP